MVMLLQTSV